MKPDFIDTFLRFCAKHEFHQELWWRTHNDDDTGDIDFYFNCNDVFCWGCADCNEITEETFSILLKCLEDVEKSCIEANESFYVYQHYAIYLYCARMKRDRPQNAFLNNIYKFLWPLFDACGPEKPVGIGNPHKRKE